MISGYEIFPLQGYEIFPLQDSRAIPERLICPYCQLVMRDPVQTEASGIIMCRGCLGEALKYVIMIVNNSNLFLMFNFMVYMSILLATCDVVELFEININP